MMLRRALGWVLAAMILVGGVAPVLAASTTDSGQGGKRAFASAKAGGKKGGKSGKRRGGKKGKKGGKNGSKRGKKNKGAASA